MNPSLSSGSALEDVPSLLESSDYDEEVGGGQDDVGEDQGQELVKLQDSTLVGLSSSLFTSCLLKRSK